MAYKHGTYQTEAASDINLPVTLDYGHFIVGMAPIHKVKKEKRKRDSKIYIIYNSNFRNNCFLEITIFYITKNKCKRK